MVEAKEGHPEGSGGRGGGGSEVVEGHREGSGGGEEE